jgi:septum formation protein
MDKAGAYHIEGGGAAFIESIEGSPSNVAGLSVTSARRLLRRAGVL